MLTFVWDEDFTHWYSGFPFRVDRMEALVFPAVSNNGPETEDIYINAGRNKDRPNLPLRGPVRQLEPARS